MTMELILHLFFPTKPFFKRSLITLWFILSLLVVSQKRSFSQEKLDSIRQALTTAVNDSVKVEMKIQISRELHKLDNHEEDIEIASQAVEEALTLNNNLLYAQALNNLGLLYRYHQQYADAIPLHKKAFDIIEHDNNAAALDKMIFANNTGVASRHNSDYNTAVYYYLKSLTIAERESDLKNIEIACNGLGNVLISIPNRQDEALAYLERALAIAKATKNSLGIAMNYLTISDYYGNKEQYTISRKFLNDLLQINIERKDNYGMAMTFQSIGNSFLAEGKDLNTARTNFNKSLELFKGLNDRLKQAYVIHSIGNIYFNEKDLSNSLLQFQKSLKYSMDLKNKRLIMKNAEMISHVYEEQSRPKQALTYYKISQQYKDSLNIAEQATEIAAINTRYNFEKKESEIALLKKDKSLQKSQLRNRGATILFMAISLFSLLLFAFFQNRNRKARIKNEQKIQQQENEKTQAVYEKNLMEAEMLATRMQVNPHFLFNCLNSIKYLIQSAQNKKATEYLVIFSRFVRMVLETSQKPLSSVIEELEMVGYYLRLEENRFNDDFTFRIDNKIPDGGKHVELPTLLLQPFVENAIWHGLLPSEKAVKNVTITADVHKSGILISIDDNGVGRNTVIKTTSTHQSMGNKISQERIQLFNKSYSSSIDCDVIDKVDDQGNAIGTCVTLFIRKSRENSFKNGTDKLQVSTLLEQDLNTN